MKKLLIITVLLLLPVSLFAVEQVSASQSDLGYIRLMAGTQHQVASGSSGKLFNGLDENIGSIRVISVEDIVSIAEAKMQPGYLLADVERVELDMPHLLDVKFQRENSESFMIFDTTGRDDIRKGLKGKLLDEEGYLVGYFRVLSAENNRATAITYSIAPDKEYDEARTAEFQDYFEQILGSTAFANFHYTNLIMIIIGLVFIYLAIAKDYEPLLLVPIGFGIIIGNIPLPVPLFNSISVYMIDPITHGYTFNTSGSSVLGMVYGLVTSGFLPPLIFLGIGAMTDFSMLLANPRTVLLGAAAQIGIFATFIGAYLLNFDGPSAASIGIIGGADGPTAIFLTSKLSPTLIGPIAIAAYSYMGLIPIIQPPLMRLLTTKKERVIRMKPGRKVSKTEKIIFPIAGFMLTTFIAPGAIPLLGMLFFGNLLKESGVTSRLAKTAANPLIDSCTILLGVGVGASTTAQVFLNEKSLFIFVLGCLAFAVATASGVLFAKFMNIFLSKENKINPLIGSAGVSAVPDAARVSEMIGREYDPDNHLLMHAMGPNVAGVIGSGIAAGIMLGIF